MRQRDVTLRYVTLHYTCVNSIPVDFRNVGQSLAHLKSILSLRRRSNYIYFATLRYVTLCYVIR